MSTDVRDWLGVPKGLKRDLRIGDDEVDIKHTIGATWMIPPETYGNEEPCLLIATAKFNRHCSLGLVLARRAYLNAPNRDQKRSISSLGRQSILWLVREASYPPSRFEGLDMERFWELRETLDATDRSAQFFRENIGRVVHRSVVKALLHKQVDYMKRLRLNGGARDQLEPEGIRLLSGAYEPQAEAAKEHGFDLARDEFVAIQTK